MSVLSSGHILRSSDVVCHLEHALGLPFESFLLRMVDRVPDILQLVDLEHAYT